MSRPVHVVHVIGWLDRGGAETLSLDVCRAIPAGEILQTFVTLGGREGTLADQFRIAGAHVRQCPLAPVATFPWRWYRLVRALRPEIVVSHVSLFSAIVLLVACVARVRVRMARIWSEADDHANAWPRRVWRAALRRLLRLVATDIVAVSSAALAFAGRTVADPGSRLLHNSVATARVEGWSRADARRKWGYAEGDRVVAYIGRAAHVKNRAFLIDVHRASHALDPRMRLLVVGPCGVDDILSAHPDVGEDPTVVLGGEVDEIASVLAAADVYVLTSLWEGLPGVVLEALATGLPVVATNLPCLREASTHVEGLTLVDLAAGPGAWAAALVRGADVGIDARRAIKARFASSPYRLEHAVAQWRTLWLDHPRSTPRSSGG